MPGVSEATCQQVKTLLKQKVSRAEIAQKLGVSLHTVDRCRYKLGLVKPRKANNTVTEALVADVKRMRSEGLSTTAIAKCVDLAVSTVQKILAEGCKTQLAKKKAALSPESDPQFGAANRILMTSWRVDEALYDEILSENQSGVLSAA